MKAVVHTRYGSPEVLVLQEILQPVPGNKDILIKVFATTVNRTDCGFLRAKPFIVRFFSGLRKPKHTSLGNEFAGIITAVGSEVTSLKPGDRVFGFDDNMMGAHAQYMVLPEKAAIAVIPENMSYEEAAPMAEGAHYALCDLRAAKLKPGQHILINGATGAIGSAAVQLARYLGARVTAVCDTRNMSLVASLGAEVVIDYTKEDFTKRPYTFDVIFDAVGKSSFGKCRPLLVKNGLYISTELGYMSQNPLLALISPFYRGKKVLFPLPIITKEQVALFKELAEKGLYKPVIDRYYPIEKIREAFNYVETGQKIGNVVIRIPQA